MDGWLDHQGPPPPPTGRDGNNDEGRNRGRGDHRDEAPRGRPHHQDRSVEDRRNRGRDESRGPRHQRVSSSSGSNWNMTASPWVENLRKRLEEAGILNKEGEHTPLKLKEANGSVPASEAGTMVVNNPDGSLANFEKQKLDIMRRTGYNNLYLLTTIMNLMDERRYGKGTIIFNVDNGEVYMGEGSGVKDKQIEKNKSSVVIEELNESEQDEGAMLSAFGYDNDQQGRVVYEEGNGQASGEETEDGNRVLLGHESSLKEGLHLESNTEIAIEEVVMESGICNNNQAVLGVLEEETSQVKRSARIKAQKNKVNYTAAAGKRSYKKKCNKAKSATLEYLKSLQPLELDQAKLVVKLAGVELQGAMEEQMAEGLKSKAVN